MISAVELCSLHQQYTHDPQQIVANALFSDGTACLILQSQSPPSQHQTWRLFDQRSSVIPGTEEMMSWRIGNHGFEMTLSPGVPDIIRDTLKPWLTEWLDDAGLSVSEISCWAIHPGGPKILSATADAIGLNHSDLSPSVEILEQYGNMSSPTVAFIVDRLQASGAKPPCVTIAFGPGLTIEAALWT
jgi:predicted naringenin-chalcone synthase